MRFIGLFAVGIVLFISCGNLSGKKSEEIIAGIDNAVMEVVNDAATYHYVALDTFPWGTDTASVVVVYDKDTPVRVAYFSEKAADNEWDFFLDTITRKTVYFLEVGLDLAQGCYFKNQFYYHNGKYVKGVTSRSGCNHPEHEHVTEWLEYESHNKDKDFRLLPDAVDALVKEIITAVEADRPGLSPMANDIRRKGASFWATGNNNGWSVTIYEDQRIDFEYGNDKQKISFTEFEELLTDETGNLIYQATLADKTLKLLFTLETCKGTDGYSYPFTVTANLDSVDYSGCGVLF